MKCLGCGKEKAVNVAPYGWLPGKKCQTKSKKYNIGETIEVSTSEIKESRKEYSKDILQPRRGDTVSKEYIKAYGTKNFTREEIRGAKNVWTENSFYKEE